MKFRKLFSTAKKIELKLALAQDATQNQVIEAPKEDDVPTNDLFLFEPKGWSSAKVLEFKNFINAWGKSQDYNGNLMSGDGTWSEKDKQVVKSLRESGLHPRTDMSSLDKMFDYFKAKSLLAQIPETFGLRDKDMQEMPSQSVAKVQEWLKDMGRYSGPTDGKWNTSSQGALADLQEANNVPRGDGSFLDAASQDAVGLASSVGLKSKDGSRMPQQSVAKVQEWLKNMNRYSGPTDGEWNLSSQRALADLQKANNVPNPTGDILDQASEDAVGLDMTLK